MRTCSLCKDEHRWIYWDDPFSSDWCEPCFKLFVHRWQRIAVDLPTTLHQAAFRLFYRNYPDSYYDNWSFKNLLETLDKPPPGLLY